MEKHRGKTLTEMKLHHAFTLIELLIVVAIIAILAAIAVPNFMEAQTRSKISRVKSDFRTLSMALESYFVDSNHYPYPYKMNIGAVPYLSDLTTPIAYISSVNIVGPFHLRDRAASEFNMPPKWSWYLYYNYTDSWEVDAWQSNLPKEDRKTWRAYSLISWGPSGNQTGSAIMPIYGPNSGMINSLYDATNGTMSNGEITRFGGDLPFTVLN